MILLDADVLLSFNLSAARVPTLPSLLTRQYGLVTVPDLHQQPDYAGCTVPELLAQISRQMSLGDAVQAVQIEKYEPTATCLLSWNAKHFLGKLVIAVLTPEEWLKRRRNRKQARGIK
ncbi:MAG: hypothetical protein KY476_13270 [Planctomycetes bacterium]|nr:hypothetical protein [Planctomycetota bacterium]